MSQYQVLTSKQKAAVLMVMLGKDASSEIYHHLTDEEIETLTLSITSLDRINKEMSEQVIEEFFEISLAQKYVTEGGMTYARDVLVSALGADRADTLLMRLTSSLQVKPFDFVRKADSTQVHNFIQNEHPQTIALVLSYLEPNRAAIILSSLDPDVQLQVIKRIAKMGIVSPNYIREAERVLENKFNAINFSNNVAVGGLDTIVKILNFVDRGTENYILKAVEQDDAELAEEIHRKLFVFDDILKLSDIALQKVLKEVDNDVISISLKGATDDMTAKVFANVSKRLQETIKENMKFMGPVRVRDVETAQQKIVNAVRKLEEGGVIEISRGGQEDGVIE